jgi:putative FmdB family regulatory protein
MPIYEYQYESCGTIVENWQRISDPPMEICNSCGGKMKKLISQSSFHLRGSGWYVTDYAGGKKEKREKRSKSSPDKDSSATKLPDKKSD